MSPLPPELPPVQTAPHPKPMSVTARTIWGSSLCHRGSRISLLAVGAPTLPRHSRDAAQGASQPGAWKVPPPQLGTAAPGCCPQGGEEGTGPSHCSCAGWGPGPGRMTRTHPCPGALPSQCRGHSLSTIPPPGDRPHRWMKPLRTQGTHLLPEIPLAASLPAVWRQDLLSGHAGRRRQRLVEQER